MKKIRSIILLLICISLFSGFKVFAKEPSKEFINNNNVKLTEKELDFIEKFYGKDFFGKMTKADYEWIQELDINNRDVEVKSTYLYDQNQPTNNSGIKRGPSYSTASKRLSIARSCSGVCTVMTNLTWLVNPTVRSYDLIGARLYNTSLANETIVTSVTSSSGPSYSSNNKVFGNGLGTSIKLPSSSNLIIQQKFYTNNGGKVYASYQHATSNITLQTSLNYNISSGGYGGVFLFYGDAVGKYDGMAGVDI